MEGGAARARPPASTHGRPTRGRRQSQGGRPGCPSDQVHPGTARARLSPAATGGTCGLPWTSALQGCPSSWAYLTDFPQLRARLGKLQHVGKGKHLGNPTPHDRANALRIRSRCTSAFWEITRAWGSPPQRCGAPCLNWTGRPSSSRGGSPQQPARPQPGNIAGQVCKATGGSKCHPAHRRAPDVPQRGKPPRDGGLPREDLDVVEVTGGGLTMLSGYIERRT